MSISFDDLQKIFELLGLNLSPQEAAVATFILLLLAIGILKPIVTGIVYIIKAIVKAISVYRQSEETRNFIKVRSRFAEHLINEINYLNQEADWNDFYYTKLEAEVEIEPRYDLEKNRITALKVFLTSSPYLLKTLFRITPSFRTVDNLTDAIQQSPSRTFLVVGDPGSGKTVSLRHLALEMAKKCSSSKSHSTPLPIYVNLKRLNVSHENLSAEVIHQWVISQLKEGQDRLIHEFLDKYFDSMLSSGNLFFLFDSFDEIPAVMDADEDAAPVREFSLAIDRFLHAPHSSRGLISSRPYRIPKAFYGQRIYVKPLNRNRIKTAINKYLITSQTLARNVWQVMIREREDLLQISSNPFYLGLLLRYVSESKVLPKSQYDMFEHFIKTRLIADRERLAIFNLSPEDVFDRASILAFKMTVTPEIGLEATVKELLCICNCSGIEPSAH